MRYISDFLHHFSEKPAFSANEARLFLKRRGASEGYHKLLLEKLYSSGRIYRITRGHYTFYEEVQHVGFAFSPFYYGLEDALSLLNLWEQETNPVVITPRKVRSGIREFRGRNYVVRRIDRSMFFGYIYIKYEKFYISVSAPEKTLIDLFYFRTYIENDTYDEVFKNIDATRFKDYLENVPGWLKSKLTGVLDDSGG
ncbi:hypothetical protein IX51_09520 [uncultured archaeon]|nr:hypothetical protein IX51_09520 [uncultured archaeon]